MDSKEIKKYIGKKCLIILKNNYKYTAVVPDFSGDSFSIIDIFHEEVGLSCDFISFIVPINEEDK
jgi:hypothetical protein